MIEFRAWREEVKTTIEVSLDLDQLTNSDGCIAEFLHVAVKETLRSFQRPFLIRSPQERLSVVGNGLAISVDYDRRVVILW